MALKLSTGMRNKLLDTNSLRSILNLGFLKIYSTSAGIPTAADDALVGGTHTLLVTISVSSGGTGLTFAATAASGAISKNGGETWSGTIAQTGTAAFYRFVASTDTGAASTSEPRVQGEVGTAGKELNLVSVSLTATNTLTIDNFSIGIPTL